MHPDLPESACIFAVPCRQYRQSVVSVADTVRMTNATTMCALVSSSSQSGFRAAHAYTLVSKAAEGISSCWRSGSSQRSAFLPDVLSFVAHAPSTPVSCT